MDCKHLAKKERMDTAVRTPHENGTLRNRGRGYPLENNMMSIRSFNSAFDDSGRRVLDVFAFAIVVLADRVIELNNGRVSSLVPCSF